MHPAQRELVREIAVQDVWSLERDQTALRGAVLQDIQHKDRIDSGLGAENNALVKRLDDVRKDQVLGQLGVQAHSGAATVVKALAHGVEIGLGLLPDLGVAAHHERE